MNRRISPVERIVTAVYVTAAIGMAALGLGVTLFTFLLIASWWVEAALS